MNKKAYYGQFGGQYVACLLYTSRNIPVSGGKIAEYIMKKRNVPDGKKIICSVIAEEGILHLKQCQRLSLIHI